MGYPILCVDCPRDSHTKGFTSKIIIIAFFKVRNAPSFLLSISFYLQSSHLPLDKTIP